MPMVPAGKNHCIPSLPKNDHCSPLRRRKTEKENIFLSRRRKTEKEKEDNIWRREIFHLRRRGRTEKETEEIFRRRKINGDANQPTGQL